MRGFLFSILTAACISLAVAAGEVCSPSSDACRPAAAGAALTPFMSGLKKAVAAAPAPAGQAPDRPAAERTPRTEKKAQEPAPAPAPEAEPADTPAAAERPFARPGWLLAPALLLTGLYYFLRSGGRKRKR
jgi:hypothetical protein